MKTSSKVTLFIGSLTGGGAERVTCNLANYLCEKGYKVDLITMSDVKDTYILSKKVNRIYLINNSERKNKISDIILRRKRLKKYILENPNVNCYITMLPITCFILTSLKKYIKCKIIISERNNPKSYGIVDSALMRYSSKRCDGLVVQTTEIGTWYKNKNKIVIPNAINKNIVLNKNIKKSKKIVAVGRLEKQKNYPMLIEAYNIFVKKYPDYILEIYGKGNQESKIKKTVEKYHLHKNIKFMGYVDDVIGCISDASIYVMTSNFEGMPNSLIEAMCIGLPCISTDCDGGGARELIINNKNGILIQKNNINELVDSMIKIVSNQNFANAIAEQARELNNILSYEKIYTKWELYVRKIIDRK